MSNSSGNVAGGWQDDLAQLRTKLLPLVAVEDALARDLSGGVAVNGTGGRAGVFVRSGWQALVAPMASKGWPGTNGSGGGPPVNDLVARMLAATKDEVAALWRHPNVRPLIKHRKLRLEESASLYVHCFAHFLTRVLLITVNLAFWRTCTVLRSQITFPRPVSPSQLELTPGELMKCLPVCIRGHIERPIADAGRERTLVRHQPERNTCQLVAIRCRRCCECLVPTITTPYPSLAFSFHLSSPLRPSTSCPLTFLMPIISLFIFP